MATKGIFLAKQRIANLINATPQEVLITSGGTESNNTVLYGIAYKNIQQEQSGEISSRNGNKQIITSAIEHDAVLEPCARLKEQGFDITYIPVDEKGIINIDKLKDAISERTCLVSIMFANNEVGTIQPISKIAKTCNDRNIPFHTDAIQAIGKIPIDVKGMKIDILSISSHKINGPKGVGALYIREGLSIKPMMLGGGQENGMRSGTENTANIVGFGKACQLAKDHLEKNSKHVRELRDLLANKILNEIPHVTYNGDKDKRIPNNAHFTFLGISGEDLIIKLDENNIAASTGSACSVNRQKASHVLQAMNFNHEQITGSLRFTVGIYNTREEILETVDILKRVVKELRRVSPFKAKYGF